MRTSLNNVQLQTFPFKTCYNTCATPLPLPFHSRKKIYSCVKDVELQQAYWFNWGQQEQGQLRPQLCLILLSLLPYFCFSSTTVHKVGIEPPFYLLIMSKSYEKWEGGWQHPLQKLQRKEYDVIETLWSKPGSLYFGHWYQEWQERERERKGEVHSFYWHQNEEITSEQKVTEKSIPYIQMLRPV